MTKLCLPAVRRRPAAESNSERPSLFADSRATAAAAAVAVSVSNSSTTRLGLTK